MISGLDHIVVLVGDIKAGATAYQKLLARAPAWQSSGDGVERMLFTLDNMTLELMSPSGDSAIANRIRAVLAEQGGGLASICFRTPDIARMHRRLDRLALKPEPIADADSRDTATGATLSWRRTRAATEASLPKSASIRACTLEPTDSPREHRSAWSNDVRVWRRPRGAPPLTSCRCRRSTRSPAD